MRPLTGFKPGEPEVRKDDCVSLVCRRQCSVDFEASLRMSFTPAEQEAAGLILFQAANHQFRLESVQEAGKQLLRLVQVTTKQEGLPFLPNYRAQTTEKVLAQREVQGDLVLKLIATGQNYDFYYGAEEEKLEPIFLHADGRLINSEEVGGMVGTMVGMFATANGAQSQNAAAFDYFRLRAGERRHL